MEPTAAKRTSLPGLPFIGTKFIHTIKIENEKIKHTLKVWTTVKNMPKMPVSILTTMTTLGNIDCLPSN